MLDLLSIWQEGLTHETYLEQFEKKFEQGPSGKPYDEYVKLNWSRTRRLEKQVVVSDTLFKGIDASTLKAICITEHWCGDSAQNLSYIARICEKVGLALKIVYRDENLDLIDQYATNGARSIPKVVVFDDNGKSVFEWGPRPKPAQVMLADYKAGNISKEDFDILVQKWYNSDKGLTLQNEWLQLLNS